MKKSHIIPLTCCNSVCIVVEPGWSEWGFWSGCSVTCGSGSRQRSRSCQSNNPEGECVGGYTEVTGCTMASCDLFTDEFGEYYDVYHSYYLTLRMQSLLLPFKNF